MHNYNGNFYGMHFLWWIVIIGLALYVIYIANNQYRTTQRKETSLEILKKRFASGEITKEEFEASKRALSGKQSKTNTKK